MTDSQFPMLVADIGGTNARFAYVTDDGVPSHVATLRCRDFSTPHDAAASYLAEHADNARVAAVMLAVAAAVPADGDIKITNGPWTVDRGAMAATCGAKSVAVYNDFEAIAFLLPYIATDDYRPIGDVTPTRHTNMVVMGPGTGLGIGCAVPLSEASTQWATVCGEGGHATLAATNAYQAAVIAAAQKDYRHVSAERLISGKGLPNLYRAVAAVEGLAFDSTLTADQIGELGSTHRDKLCERTMSVFCAFLGGIAGNVALTVGAKGGVFIAGGIVPKLGAFFFESEFRAEFESKGRYVDYLKPIGTALLTTPYPALAGLARRASAGERLPLRRQD
jgi:glucokinase